MYPSPKFNIYQLLATPASSLHPLTAAHPPLGYLEIILDISSFFEWTHKHPSSVQLCYDLFNQRPIFGYL